MYLVVRVMLGALSMAGQPRMLTSMPYMAQANRLHVFCALQHDDKVHTLLWGTRVVTGAHDYCP